MRRPTTPAILLEPPDYREKVRQRKIGNLILFVVDASGSMAAERRMVAVKSAILSLLVDAYQKRDQVGLIAFRGRSAELLLPPTNSVDLADRVLRVLPTGGRTPLSHGLELAARTIEQARATDRGIAPLLVLVSDGRPNLPLTEGADPVSEACALGRQLRRLGAAALVLDTESGPIRIGCGRDLSEALGAQYWHLADLAGDRVAGAVQSALPVPATRRPFPQPTRAQPSGPVPTPWLSP